jgi:predicted  nucleic acid-binding Zn-ribbon protein
MIPSPNTQSKEVIKHICQKCGSEMRKWFNQQIFEGWHCSDCGYDEPQSKEVEIVEEIKSIFSDAMGSEPVEYDSRLDNWLDVLVKQIKSDTESRVRREMVEIENKYQELIMAVGNKYPGETRHQTALRYIKNAEVGENRPSKSLLKETK